MSKKKRSKSLLIAFVCLLVIVFILQMVDSSKGERSFKKEIVTLDTANVTSIIIQQHGKPEVELSIKGDSWIVNSDGIEALANENVIKSMLSSLNHMQPERVAATKKEKWTAFEVSDSTGIRVKVKGNDKLLTDLVVGKFSYKQFPQGGQGQQMKMTSYVRLFDENEVYAVDGFLKMTFNGGMKNFRKKSLVDVKMDDITKIKYTNEDNSSFTLLKNNNNWMVGDVAADSASTVKYLNSPRTMWTYTVSKDGAVIQSENKAVTPLPTDPGE